MANKDAAFGLRPIGKVGQNADNNGLSEYDIAASASAIYFQDPVEILATGTIGVAAATDALLGSLNGVFFTDATTSKPTFANHLNASNTATDIKGFVTDDPYQRYEVQSDNSGASAQTDIGNVADIVYAAGSSPDYVSKVELDDSDLATSDGQLKVIGVSKDPDNNEIGSANVNFVVTINEHFLKQEAGV
tara:strand:- start:248 stop:817 length:570 start_codon:yes stop_codon:yes gene_type:complete